MPKFTIIREGRKIDEITASGDRIELGSARSCAVSLDDLLISLKQAALVRGKAGEPYRIEPMSRLPAFTLDGATVDQPLPVQDGATVEIEGYQIKIHYLSGEIAGTAPRVSEPGAAAADQALPPPLEPDLPPPLEPGEPALSAAVPTSTVPPIRHETPATAGDLDKTVFVRRVGKLVAIGGPLAGQHWDLASGETKIGRDPAQNHVVIRLDAQGQVDNSISRRHASVHVMGEKVFVEDQKSAAGTFVAGRQLPPSQKVEIKDQDVIEIRSSKDSTFLRLELLRSTAPPPPPIARPEPVAAPVREPAPAAPRHDELVPADEGEGSERAAGRRRRRTTRADYDENPFMPMEQKQGGRARPRWMWVVAAAALLVIGALVILVLG